jgi:branched-subunit amino acid ABC-type transport system permease component
MILAVIALTALILGAIGVVLGTICLSLVVGLKNSTHKMTFIDPATQSFSDFGPQAREDLAKSDDTLETIT